MHAWATQDTANRDHQPSHNIRLSVEQQHHTQVPETIQQNVLACQVVQTNNQDTAQRGTASEDDETELVQIGMLPQPDRGIALLVYQSCVEEREHTKSYRA